METSQSTTVSEAVGIYIGSLKLPAKQEGAHRELFRFVRWCGRERDLARMAPSVIGDYADQVVGRGTTPLAAEHLQVVKAFLAYARKKGLIETNLAQHVRIRKSRTRVVSRPAQDIPPPVALTTGGRADLVSRLRKLKGERVPLAKQIQLAAADKDVRENVPLEAAREQLGHIESRIKSIENVLISATTLDPSAPLPQGQESTVRLGARISIKDLTTGRETSYMLVSASEANPVLGKISDGSPLGKALINRHVGQEVEASTPRGGVRYLILDVSS